MRDYERTRMFRDTRGPRRQVNTLQVGNLEKIKWIYIAELEDQVGMTIIILMKRDVQGLR